MDRKTYLENRIRELKLEKLRRLTEEKFQYYTPNGKCEEFIKAVGCGDFFIVLFSAANGVGKTCVSANIVANIIWGEESENGFFNLPLFKNWPYPKVGRIASNATNIEKNLIPTLKNWFPKNRYKTRKGNKSFDSIWETDNGWMFDIMTYQQDPSEFESSTIGWAWFDEPPTEAIFKATIARLRKGGIIFISETPLNGSAWLYDYIVAGQNDDLKKMGIAKYIEADVESACREHGLRGHLDHDVIQKQIASYSEEDKQARIYGKFQHLIGLRYKQFSRDIHIIKPFNIDPRNFCVYHALDTHPRNPDAALWIAVDRKGTKYIVDELYIKAVTSELAQRIKMKNSQYRVVRKIIEPASFIEDQHTGNCLATQLLALGLNYIEASKERTNSDRRIEEALSYQKINLGDHDEYLKMPELFIFDNCVRTIWEFEHYRWDEYTGRSADKHNSMEKTVDKDDHMIEDIGRILIQEPRFVEMPIVQSYPQEPKKSFDPYRR